jgi:hypothetical protein
VPPLPLLLPPTASPGGTCTAAMQRNSRSGGCWGSAKSAARSAASWHCCSTSPAAAASAAGVTRTSGDCGSGAVAAAAAAAAVPGLPAGALPAVAACWRRRVASRLAACTGGTRESAPNAAGWTLGMESSLKAPQSKPQTRMSRLVITQPISTHHQHWLLAAAAAAEASPRPGPRQRRRAWWLGTCGWWPLPQRTPAAATQTHTQVGAPCELQLRARVQQQLPTCCQAAGLQGCSRHTTAQHSTHPAAQALLQYVVVWAPQGAHRHRGVGAVGKGVTAPPRGHHLRAGQQYAGGQYRGEWESRKGGRCSTAW